VRGHTLVWHSQTPVWFFKENFNESGNWVTPEVMDQRMESYIRNMFELITTSYPNLNLYAYDVVNEAAKDNYQNSGPRDAGDNSSGEGSMWVRVYGDNSFVKKAFQYARQYAPPSTKLFYNDYNEYMGAKHTYIVNSIVRPLYEEGLLDGMGMQSHLNVNKDRTDAYPTPTDYGNAITAYKNIGVEIHISELDVTVSSSSTTDFNLQATYYKNIMNQILTKGGSAVKAVVVWGIQDNQSWRSSNYPLLWDGSGNKKAAYNELVSLIPESEWGEPPSSSSGPDDGQICGNYQLSFCGNKSFGSIISNSTAVPSNGDCMFIEDFETIQPSLSSTVLINGEENVCGNDWSADVDDLGIGCGHASKPAATVDGGYYVYVKEGTINCWNGTTTDCDDNPNGWVGIVAKAKPACDTPIKLISPISVAKFRVRSLSNSSLQIESNSDVAIYLYNAKGKLAQKIDVPTGSSIVKLSVPAGIYIVKNGKTKQTQRILVK
jgi:GH35 family endo-1,4-beta-xylanase